MGRNGYEPSVFDTEQGTCFLCGAEGDTVRHEAYFGSKNRRMSKEKGAWANICPRCHRIIHEKPDDGKLDWEFKQICQKAIIDKLDSEGHDGRKIFYAWFRRYYD